MSILSYLRRRAQRTPAGVLDERPTFSALYPNSSNTKRRRILGIRVVEMTVAQWAIGMWRTPLGTALQFRHKRYLIIGGSE